MISQAVDLLREKLSGSAWISMGETIFPGKSHRNNISFSFAIEDLVQEEIDDIQKTLL